MNGYPEKSDSVGSIVAVRGSLVTAVFPRQVRQNEVAHILLGEERLESEVVRIRGNRAELQVYEETRGVKVGDPVSLSGELLTAELGPGLLGQVYDGLQNPLPEMAARHGYFLKRGIAVPALNCEQTWSFEPTVREGEIVSAGHPLGWVPEGIFQHRIMVPFYFQGHQKVLKIAEKRECTLKEPIAVLEDPEGHTHSVSLSFHWPVKVPVRAYKDRLRPSHPLITRIRMIDTFFPIAKGGTYCIPGPFGAGKTVLQQITSRNAEVDIVIIAACGERAGEVVETLKEFPSMIDPRTGRSLMERTIIICNTSAMPVASRESSVYTAATLGEYYRQMGLDVLLLADSTSRWAQAMRELSGRLEEIPGDEAYPAYLESRIAGFYERAGMVRLHTGETGSLTIGGTVSPAGGTFEEPVTQGTLKVVGAFHGLSRARANARRFPSIDPHESWSKYSGIVDPERMKKVRALLSSGREVERMMKVVGEEGTSLGDYVVYLKAEFLDRTYMQQNGLDEVDGSTTRQRQTYVFERVVDMLDHIVNLENKDQALGFFQTITQSFIDWNYTPFDSEEFKQKERDLTRMITEAMSDAQDL
jgi:V/A-type H+-transporting ATPase subunit A